MLTPTYLVETLDVDLESNLSLLYLKEPYRGINLAIWWVSVFAVREPVYDILWRLSYADTNRM